MRMITLAQEAMDVLREIRDLLGKILTELRRERERV